MTMVMEGKPTSNNSSTVQVSPWPAGTPAEWEKNGWVLWTGSGATKTITMFMEYWKVNGHQTIPPQCRWVLALPGLQVLHSRDRMLVARFQRHRLKRLLLMMLWVMTMILYWYEIALHPRLPTTEIKCLRWNSRNRVMTLHLHTYPPNCAMTWKNENMSDVFVWHENMSDFTWHTCARNKASVHPGPTVDRWAPIICACAFTLGNLVHKFTFFFEVYM